MNAFIITSIGIGSIILYSIITLLNYYGVQVNTYGIYISFYAFLFISTLILPKQPPEFE